MAGRGRGRGTSSFTQEQLQMSGKDMTPLITVPPQVFPALNTKPYLRKGSTEQHYELLWFEDFSSLLYENSFRLEKVKNVLLSSQLRYWNVDNNRTAKIKREVEFSSARLPMELSQTTRKRQLATQSSKDQPTSKKDFDINQHLRMLEERERVEPQEEKQNSESENDEQDEIQDEEMDEENDYGHSYFDNGEGFNNEDDDMDDGPIY